jgi:hypothetical protein
MGGCRQGREGAVNRKRKPDAATRQAEASALMTMQRRRPVLPAAQPRILAGTSACARPAGTGCRLPRPVPPVPPGMSR